MQKKIDELKDAIKEAEDKLRNFMAVINPLSDEARAMLDGPEVYCVGNRIWKNCTEDDEVKAMLQALPPTQTGWLIEHGKDKYEVDSAYNVKTHSSVRKTGMQIDWRVHDIEVSVKFPAKLMDDFLIQGNRRVTDSELHYFGGVSMKEIENISIPIVKSKRPSVSYYGGHTTSISPVWNDEVVNFFIHPEEHNMEN